MLRSLAQREHQLPAQDERGDRRGEDSTGLQPRRHRHDEQRHHADDRRRHRLHEPCRDPADTQATVGGPQPEPRARGPPSAASAQEQLVRPSAIPNNSVGMASSNSPTDTPSATRPPPPSPRRPARNPACTSPARLRGRRPRHRRGVLDAAGQGQPSTARQHPLMPIALGSRSSQRPMSPPWSAVRRSSRRPPTATPCNNRPGRSRPDGGRRYR